MIQDQFHKLVSNKPNNYKKIISELSAGGVPGIYSNVPNLLEMVEKAEKNLGKFHYVTNNVRNNFLTIDTNEKIMRKF